MHNMQQLHRMYCNVHMTNKYTLYLKTSNCSMGYQTHNLVVVLSVSHLVCLSKQTVNRGSWLGFKSSDLSKVR